MSALGQKRTSRHSFDDLVSAGKQLRGQWELQHSRRLRVDDKLKLGGLHNWQVGRLCALKNATAIETDLPNASAMSEPKLINPPTSANSRPEYTARIL
jgi:hypothetical protein